MPALTTDVLRDTFAVTVTFPVETDRTDPDDVRNIFESFFFGLNYGFFDVHPNTPAICEHGPTWEESDDRIRVVFGARNLPLGAFTVLKGMFVGLMKIVEDEISSVVLQFGGPDIELLQTSLQPLAPAGPPPFAGDIPTEGNLYKSLRIWLDFIAPIPEEERDALLELFTVWKGLVLGAFPREGRTEGESWAGPSSTSFLLPERVEHYVEDFESGAGAFDLLFRALHRVHGRLPIAEIEIE